MSEIFLPTLSHWQHGNCWSGSLGRASYYAAPRGEDGPVEIFVEAWTGPLCYELSQAERSAAFPVSDEGLADLRVWLETVLPELAGKPS